MVEGGDGDHLPHVGRVELEGVGVGVAGGRHDDAAGGVGMVDGVLQHLGRVPTLATPAVVDDVGAVVGGVDDPLGQVGQVPVT